MKRERTATKLRAARRAAAWISVPSDLLHGEEFFAKSIEAFPGNLSADGKSELAMRLGLAGYQAVFAGKLGVEEADRKKLRAILASVDRKLRPLLKRNPLVAEHIEFPLSVALALVAPHKKAEEPHTVLLRGIFTAYTETRRRYPSCKAPKIGLKVRFRKFLSTVLVNFGLGPIGDKIGEGELRGAWRRWSGRTSKQKSRLM